MISFTASPSFDQIGRTIEAAVQRGLAAAQKELASVKLDAPPSSSKAHQALRAALGKIDTSDRTLATAQQKASVALQTALQ